MVELAIALAIGGMVLLVAIPAFTSVVERSRLDIATRYLTNEVRSARSKAVTTGWEYKLMGFGSASTSTNAKRYRLLARKTSATAWPADTVAPFSSTTQYAGPWSDPSKLDKTLELLPGGTGTNARFEIAFDARGAVTTAGGDFASGTPFRVRVKTRITQIIVSPVGGVTTQ